MEEREISKATYSKNRKADRIHQLHKELRMLAKQLKVAADEEKAPPSRASTHHPEEEPLRILWKMLRVIWRNSGSRRREPGFPRRIQPS